MARYRKKPVEIEAEQWNPGVQHPGVSIDDEGRAYVTTIHDQRAYLAPGDYVIPEPAFGRFYPCKPDIFVATYDPVA